jgi:hypothetical protein
MSPFAHALAPQTDLLLIVESFSSPNHCPVSHRSTTTPGDSGLTSTAPTIPNGPGTIGSTRHDPSPAEA